MTHLLLGLSVWNSLFRRFLYLCTCCPICCHFLRRRISDSRSYFFMIRSTVLGSRKNILAFQPQPHLLVAVSVEAAFPLLCDKLSKSRILFWLAQAITEGIVFASGYCEEFAHDSYWILCSVTIYDVIFYSCPHFLPVKCRKSRSKLFSIRSRRIS